jgi:N-methylhydantoinase A
LPTITDAHLVRQTIRPEAFLGGRMKIDEDAARRALEPIAARFGMSVEEAADSAVQLANANIVRAIQLISTERGHDPRDYVLVPYGGAGPLHAAAVAQDLGIRTIVVPPNSGVISAYGLLASDFIQFESLTRRALVDEDAPRLIRSVFLEMQERALARARTMGLSADVKLDFVADMRFVGQAFEVPVELASESLESLTAAELRRLFGEAHHRVYFFGAAEDKSVEIVSFRMGLTSPLEEVPVLTESSDFSLAEREIDMFEGRTRRRARLLSRSSLAPGQAVAGPALLEDPTSTLLVPSDWSAQRDGNDNMIIAWVNADA